MSKLIPNHAHKYGAEPKVMQPMALGKAWTEFLHYLYLPVRIPAYDLMSLPENVLTPTGPWARVPERLWFLKAAIQATIKDARDHFEHLQDPYVYVTARRGFAAPGNPLNRPGWHCDDFMGTDINYIWSDRFPTRFLVAERDTGGLVIPQDDQESMAAMTRMAETNPYADVHVVDGPINHLTRLTPYVIHDTPIIEAPGGMRSFFKISVSTHRYNLVGNSRNYLLDYDWPMHDREALRNQPEKRNGDYVETP